MDLLPSAMSHQPQPSAILWLSVSSSRHTWALVADLAGPTRSRRQRHRAPDRHRHRRSIADSRCRRRERGGRSRRGTRPEDRARARTAVALRAVADQTVRSPAPASTSLPVPERFERPGLSPIDGAGTACPRCRAPGRELEPKLFVRFKKLPPIPAASCAPRRTRRKRQRAIASRERLPTASVNARARRPESAVGLPLELVERARTGSVGTRCPPRRLDPVRFRPPVLRPATAGSP
jgi:hypothetical protein